MQTTHDIPSLFSKAYTLQHQNEVQAAIPLYQEILSKQPDHVEAMRYLGLAYAQSGDMHKAIEWMGKALVQRPDDANLHMNMGNAYKQLGEFDKAVGHY